jgi:[protein-PII] uridylyltransferase
MPAPAPSAHVVHIPAAAHLDAAIAALADLPRPEAVAGFKELRQAELKRVAAWQVQHLNEATGLDVAMHIAGMTDAVVRALAQRAARKAQAPADWLDTAGVFAVGGYGRGEQCPSSDLDLLMLCAAPKPPPWWEAFAAELNSLCWDVKFTVGAHKRTAAELAHMIEDDFVTATALVEQRPVLSGARPAQAVTGMLDDFRRRRAVPFLRYKIDEMAKRRDGTGASLLLMEPNLKSNPGCLRDVQLLRNIAFAVFGSRNILCLGDLEAIPRGDLTRVLAANDHLLQLRCLMHAHHGRKEDVLRLSDQVRIANQLGYADVSRLRAVEHFMKHHYAQVRHVHAVIELTVSRLRAQGHLGRKPIFIRSRKRIDDEFAAVEGLVYRAPGQAFWQRPDAAARVLAVARRAQREGWRLSLELQRDIAAHLEAVTDEARHDRTLGRQFLEILGDTGRVHPILHDLHAAGFLGAYLPEFGNLTCHMQFDSYHQYTVDEHTLLAVHHLDQVALGKLPGLPGMARIFPTVQRKDLLALGLLLHDMGKYMGRGHVARGALMVAGVAERLGLSRDEEDLLYFLVERHVSLSDASRMRNFREPSFLGPFTERIGSVAQLDALYCLTYCDAKAVGDGVLTGWQEELLGELRLAVVERLAGPDAPAREPLEARLRRGLTAAGLSAAEAEAWIADTPNFYEHGLSAAEITRQAQVLRTARERGAGLAWELSGKGAVVTAAVRDRHALFADVAATLTGHGFDIVEARTWILREGIVIYRLRVASIYPQRLGDADLWAALTRDLEAVAAGTLDAAQLLAKRRKAVLMNAPADSGFDDPAVKVEQRTSDSATIVDVHAKDEVGLLSRICRAISDVGCEIDHACINTMGDVAVDVFYVHRGGAKLSDDEAERLRLHLIATLGLKTAA